MRTSVFNVQRMDCSAEEQLVQMRLATVAGVENVRIDLDKRTVTVFHDTETSAVLAALQTLNLDTTQLSKEDEAAPSVPDHTHVRERRVLVAALAINAVLFGAEFAAGIVSDSMGLIADSLDMLADAGVYGLSLVAVGGSMLRKRRLAAASGYLQLGLAVAGLIEVTRRFLGDDPVPDVRTMILISLVALSGNIVTLIILRRAKSPEIHFQASWIFTANDIKVNTLVIIAAIVVAITNNPSADLIAGAAIFIIVANGARRILALAR